MTIRPMIVRRGGEPSGEDIFAVYLAAVDTMYQRLADAGINVGGPPFDPDSPASPEVLAMYEAWRDLIAMTQKVRLFGSRAVRHAADLLLRNTLELVKRVGSGQDLPIHPLDAKVMDQVMVAMREDLGVG